MKILILEVFEGEKANEFIRKIAEIEGVDLKTFDDNSVLLVPYDEITNQQSSIILKTLFPENNSTFPEDRQLDFKKSGIIPDKNNKYYIVKV